jgi:maleylpyruvate isomerase
VPPGAWQNPVTWTTGQQTPARHVPECRLAEVLLHHVDLNRAFGPHDWPATWTAWMLDLAMQGLNDERRLAPLAAGLHATDTGREFHLAGPSQAPARRQPGATGSIERITGPEPDILPWLTGRSDGATLTRDTPGPLPSVPSIYYT